MSNKDELSLLGLNQSSDMVKTILDIEGLGGLNLLALSLGRSHGGKTSLLLNLGLRLILAQQAKGLGGYKEISIIVRKPDGRQYQYSCRGYG